MASLTIKNVAKHFQQTEVLRDISLDVGDREFLVLVGPSGCCKSTMLLMIAGLEETTDGEIFIDVRVVNPMPSSELDIAMVFQDYALYPHMTFE